MHSDDSVTYELWKRSEYLELGKLICNHVPSFDQPKWFGHLLDMALSDEEKIGVIRVLLWPNSREIFYSLREETLACEKSKHPDNRQLGILYLAENIAKVTFNSSDSKKISLTLMLGNGSHSV